MKQNNNLEVVLATLLTSHLYVLRRTCVHSRTHTFNLPLSSSLLTENSLFTFLFLLAYFIILFFQSLSSPCQLCIMPHSFQLLLISPLFSLSIPLLVLFSLPPPVILLSIFAFLSHRNPSQTLISHPQLPPSVFTTSPALSFSLRHLSRLVRKLNFTNTLTSSSFLMLFCCCC